MVMREAYLGQLDLPSHATVCELGCGTGVVSCAIAARAGFDGGILGIDLSQALIAEAHIMRDLPWVLLDMGLSLERL